MIEPEDIVTAARKLSPAARLKVVEEILDSVDVADATVDAAWAREAEDRVAAYRRGDLRALSLSDVLARYAKT